MTTKDYLNQISRLNRMINNKLVELAQLKELAWKMRMSIMCCFQST